jgi:hypothetical protein
MANRLRDACLFCSDYKVEMMKKSSRRLILVARRLSLVGASAAHSTRDHLNLKITPAVNSICHTTSALNPMKQVPGEHATRRASASTNVANS